MVLCGSGGGMRKWMWVPGQNLARVRREKDGGWVVLLPGAGCPGVMARCPGSGSVDELEEHRVERSNRGKMRKILWMEIGEKVGEC